MDLGQVFTNQIVAQFMASLFTVDKGATVLDPCFGKGAFIDACLENGFENIQGYEIDPNLCKLVLKKHPSKCLKQKNFLEVNSEIKYDAIVMNPPYIRHEKIDELAPLGITKEAIRKDPVFAGLPSSANMYMYFIIKALTLLKPKGELVVVFPSSWLLAKNGKNFKQKIRAFATIERRIYVTGTSFEQKALVDVIILKLIQGKHSIKERVEYAKIINNEIVLDLEYKASEHIKLPIPFTSYATIRRGLTTGCNKIFINPNIRHDDTNFVPIICNSKSIHGYTTEGVPADSLLFIRQNPLSKAVKIFLKDCETHIKETKLPLTLYKRIQENKIWYKVLPVNSEGILLNYFVRNNMKFIMNPTATFVRDNFYIIKPTINNYLHFALLNNLYTYYQLECIGKRYGAGLLKLQKYDIESITFPDINTFTPSDIKSLIKYAQYMEKTGVDKTKEITQILSTYTLWDYDKIYTLYTDIKKNRLSGES